MINLINEIAGSNSNNIFGSTRPAGVTLNVNIIGADSEPNNFSPNDTLSQTLLSLINQLAQQNLNNLIGSTSSKIPFTNIIDWKKK